MSMQPNNYYSALRLQDKLKCQCNLTNIAQKYKKGVFIIQSVY